jgi:hypothetical protein
MFSNFRLKSFRGSADSPFTTSTASVRQLDQLESRETPGSITRTVETGQGFTFNTYAGYTVANQGTTLVNSVQVNANAIGLRAYAYVSAQVEIYSRGQLVYRGPRVEATWGLGVYPQTKTMTLYQLPNRVAVDRADNMVKINFFYQFVGAVGSTLPNSPNDRASGSTSVTFRLP